MMLEQKQTTDRRLQPYHKTNNKAFGLYRDQRFLSHWIPATRREKVLPLNSLGTFLTVCTRSVQV